jgi:hypothetical protein
MLEGVLGDVGGGAEHALADWLEENGEDEAAGLARSLRGWSELDGPPVLLAVARRGGGEAVRRALPWSDTDETALRLRGLLARGWGRRWSVRAASKGRVVVCAAPGRAIVGRMTTADWHVLVRVLQPAAAWLWFDEQVRVTVPNAWAARRAVLEALRARNTAPGPG